MIHFWQGIIIMPLDVSSAEQLVRDFLQMAEDYRAHNPELSKELEAKAGEIIHDLGLDVGPLGGKAVSIEPYQKAPATNALKAPDRDLDARQAEPEAFEEEDQLLQILDHQRALVEAQAEDNKRQSTDQSRSKSQSWTIFGSWLRPQSA